ncbi:hypothetical protein TNCT_393171 [Trichonephila clavata]|uniref:Uncharacterized protein n=1 Tax=Trichonephila clavata TaxID=2740835 RepID=A0A8X6HPK4_TRICU|nr:hypothetical protein TNCT_393171 [Trichonephila clavata]
MPERTTNWNNKSVVHESNSVRENHNLQASQRITFRPKQSSSCSISNGKSVSVRILRRSFQRMVFKIHPWEKNHRENRISYSIYTTDNSDISSSFTGIHAANLFLALRGYNLGWCVLS